LGTQSAVYTTNDWLGSDAYDRNGNTLWSTNGTTVTGPYGYDVQNRLTNYNNSVYVGYDGDGNRVWKRLGTTTTWYLVEDRNPSGYAQVVEEWTNSSTATNLSRVYNYGLNLISQRAPGISTNYFIWDGHGSTRVLADAGGNTVNVFAYDAYGTLIASNGTPGTAYLYCGQQWDGDLGLYDNHARYLNVGTGRFWTMDTYEGSSEDPLSLHKYLYCQANPANMVDPSGHDGDLPSLSATMGIISNIGARVGYVALRAMNAVNSIPGLSTTIIGGQTMLTWWGISQDPNQAALYLETGGLAADFAFLKSMSSSVKTGVVAMYAGINDARQAQGAVAILTKDTISGGTKALQSIEPPGWNLLPALNRARAHLLGRSLGGNGNLAENLVTMYQTANQRMYNQFEQKVAEAAQAGAKVEYAATPIYGNLPYPTKIHCYAKGDNGLDIDMFINNEP